MKKIIMVIFSVSLTFSAFAGQVTCFKSKDLQFHLAVGPEYIADFSYTSFSLSKKILKLLGKSAGINLPRSGDIALDSRFCQEDDKTISCDINNEQAFTVFNTWGNNIVRKGGISGNLVFNKTTNVLSLNVSNDNGQNLNEDLRFEMNQCH
ncbi:MAG: hypothetical protein AB7I27_01675 [Bacteriovoracaceae bacterium]